MNVDQWFDEFWMKNYYTLDGELFTMLNRYIPQLFTEIREQIKPTIEKSNTILAV